jgi:DNA-directed RNA polymerase I subunit RPA2
MLESRIHARAPFKNLSVILDGLVVGSIALPLAEKFVFTLRRLKVAGHPIIPRTMEIYPIFTNEDQLFPSIYLYTTAARVIRPVRSLFESSDSGEDCIEWIGSQEQLTMEIALTSEDYRAGETSHQELSPAGMLSVVASMTPFSDHNQSPRNC